MRDQQYKLSRRCPRVLAMKGVGPGRVSGSRYELFSDISVGQCMFRRCVFLFSGKRVLENFLKESFEKIF